MPDRNSPEAHHRLRNQERPRRDLNLGSERRQQRPYRTEDGGRRDVHTIPELLLSSKGQYDGPLRIEISRREVWQSTHQDRENELGQLRI